MSYKAFLSSTFEDLKTHREFVIGALRRSGFVADPMEEWGPAPEEPKVFSQERIEGCDVFVLLVAFRRGYVPEGEDLSITQLEYQAAREFGVDVLAFVLEKDAAWPRRYDELEKDRLLVRWRGDLMKAHGVRFFYRAPESIDIEPALTRWTVERQARQEAARSSEEAGRRAEAGARATAGSFDRELESIEIDSALARRTNEKGAIVEPEAPPLPGDGRYRLSNDAVSLELRIDLEVPGIVSADVFALGDGHREHVASLRSHPGLELTSESNPVSIVVAGVDGRRSQGKITLSGDAETTAVLTVNGQIKALPRDQPMSFIGRFEGRAMRALSLELETEAGTETDIEWPFESDVVTLESCLAETGFEVSRVDQRNQIPAPANGSWDDSQLHGLMSQFAQEPADRRSWNLHVLMLQLSRLQGLNGVMFDSVDQDLNHLPRQGAAIFQHESKFPIIDAEGNRSSTPRPDWQRKLIKTTVHQIGHALNLAHRFEPELGRADSLSFMNYDWRYKGGGNAVSFWRDFAFTFDPDELAFLRHGPRDAVIPGSAEFRTVPYWENLEGGYSPYRAEEIPTDDLRLNLLPPAPGTLFQFGQPVLLTVELINTTGQVLELPGRLLDPKSGFLRFVIQRTGRTNADRLDFNPIIHRCFDLGPAHYDLIEPGGKLTNNVNLTFGSAGFTFVEPGNYEVTAVFTAPILRHEELIAESAPLRLRIAYPKSDEEERDGLRLFRHDIGLYLALGGSDVLPEAEEALLEIVERRQRSSIKVTDPLVTNILRCQAINHSREFVRYQGGRFAVREARPDEAKKLFDLISSASAGVFDHHTRQEIRQLAAAQGPGK